MCCIVFRRHTGAVQIDNILRRKPISCSSGINMDRQPYDGYATRVHCSGLGEGLLSSEQ